MGQAKPSGDFLGHPELGPRAGSRQGVPTQQGSGGPSKSRRAPLPADLAAQSLRPAFPGTSDPPPPPLPVTDKGGGEGQRQPSSGKNRGTRTVTTSSLIPYLNSPSVTPGGWAPTPHRPHFDQACRHNDRLEPSPPGALPPAQTLQSSAVPSDLTDTYLELGTNSVAGPCPAAGTRNPEPWQSPPSLRRTKGNGCCTPCTPNYRIGRSACRDGELTGRMPAARPAPMPHRDLPLT